MNVQPTLEVGHQEFHFAENTDSCGVCCCWSSKTKKPKEYIFDQEGKLIGINKADKMQRAISNAKLNEIIMSHFEPYPIEKEEALLALKERINEEVDSPHIPITKVRIRKIIYASIEIRKELQEKSKKKTQNQSNQFGLI